MKKITMMLCLGVLAFTLAACGDGANGNNGTESTTEEGTENNNSSDNGSEEDSVASTDESSTESVPGDAGTDSAQGWSEEMEGLRAVVVEAVGTDEYWPNMPIDQEMLETFYGLTSDMYEDYMAESPMISANVDTLMIVRAKEDKADEVESALTAYREALVNDSLQYPQNLGKIQASQVEKIGNYVIFVQLGGSAIESDKEEDALKLCQEANEKAIEAIRNIVEQ